MSYCFHLKARYLRFASTGKRSNRPCHFGYRFRQTSFCFPARTLQVEPTRHQAREASIQILRPARRANRRIRLAARRLDQTYRTTPVRPCGPHPLARCDRPYRFALVPRRFADLTKCRSSMPDIRWYSEPSAHPASSPLAQVPVQRSCRDHSHPASTPISS